jgi:hypothetical protein
MNSALQIPRSTSVGVVARLGFEPRQTESESVVLPLHHRAIRGGGERMNFAPGVKRANG